MIDSGDTAHPQSTRNADYDVIVIGAGPVGENVADRVAQGGLSVVVVERELVGGECSYWACMPSKALLRSGAALRAAQDVAGASAAVIGDFDVPAVFARRDSFTSNWDDHGQAEWLASAGIDLVRGHARISGEREVFVKMSDGDEVLLRARYAVAVCTGSAARLPDIAGLADVDPWTSREATSAKQAPASLIVIGGGVVACELATAYASFGTLVSIVARSGLLTTFEPFVGEAVREALASAGVDTHIDASPSSVTRDARGVAVQVDGRGELTAAEVVVATGRVPRTGDLGIETVGLTPDDWLNVDDTQLVEGFDWLYGVGDVNHRALFTHQGKYQARAAGDAIVARARGNNVDLAPWGTHVASADHFAVPQVVFTDPEVAAVGLTEARAKDAGIRLRVLDYDLASVAGASLFSDKYRGRARAIVDDDRGVLVGATFVGPEVAELLHAATIAIVGEVPIERLWHAVPAYPTVSEVWLRWLEEYGRPRSGV